MAIRSRWSIRSPNTSSRPPPSAPSPRWSATPAICSSRTRAWTSPSSSARSTTWSRHPIEPRALSEAARVTRPGGLIVAAAINRYAGLIEYGSHGALTEENLPEFTDALATGRNHDDPNGFTNAYFHHADELAAELETAGLTEVEIVGVEGPAANVLHNATGDDIDALLPSALLLARQLESDPNLIAAGFHFLAQGRRR